jgi:hypothetical protein
MQGLRQRFLQGAVRHQVPAVGRLTDDLQRRAMFGPLRPKINPITRINPGRVFVIGGMVNVAF